MTLERLQPTEPTVIYMVVPCPSCSAAALTPCLEGGRILDGDVHLDRARLFASARFEHPEWGLKVLMNLRNGEYQP